MTDPEVGLYSEPHRQGIAKNDRLTLWLSCGSGLANSYQLTCEPLLSILWCVNAGAGYRQTTIAVWFYPGYTHLNRT
jgi:hypothetical protein